MDTTHLLFIHGGGDDGYGTDSKLADSLQKNLGGKYKVAFPHMPTPEFDASESWQKKIHEAIAAHQPTFLVGHSFGASTLLQYVVNHGMPQSVQGVFLIAPPFWGSDSSWSYKEFALPSNFCFWSSLTVIFPLFPCSMAVMSNLAARNGSAI